MHRDLSSVAICAHPDGQRHWQLKWSPSWHHFLFPPVFDSIKERSVASTSASRTGETIAHGSSLCNLHRY
jgi:hypothetical protein